MTEALIMRKRRSLTYTYMLLLIIAGVFFAQTTVASENSLPTTELSEVTVCSHQHDEECYVQNCLHAEHNELCGYIEGVEGMVCSHMCSEDLGCIVFSCAHTCGDECLMNIADIFNVSEIAEESGSMEDTSEEPESVIEPEEQSNYKIIIPSTIELNRDGGTLTIKAEEMKNIQEGITISVVSMNGFHLISSEGTSIPYTLLSYAAAVQNGDAVATFQEDGRHTISFELSDVPDSGIYRDTLTFSLALN